MLAKLRAFFLAALCAISVPALAQVASPQAIAQAKAKLASARWIQVGQWIRHKPDRMIYVPGRAINDPARIKAIGEETLRLLQIGTAAIQGRDGPRDFSSYWCGASIAFMSEDPSTSSGSDPALIEVCGRPGRFLTIETKKFPYAIKLEQPRQEIRRLLSLIEIAELPDCPEPQKPHFGSDYEDFKTPCW